MPQPPTTTPAEALKISPEALTVANSYLQTNSIEKTSEELGLDLVVCQDYLARHEVKRYVDQVFHDTGFNNRYKMRAAMDAIIRQKFQELEEAGAGSGKDIADLLALSHKMSMDLLDRELELEKLRQKTSEQHMKTQVNVQINDSGTKYGELINRLLQAGEGSQSVGG